MNPTIKNHSEKIIGYKAVKKDEGGYYCDGNGDGIKTYFEIGSEYTTLEKPVLCKSGFHFFRHFCFAIDYFESGNAILKVESFGDVQEDTEKCVSNKIKVISVEYAEDHDFSFLENRNSGNRNSGNRNSGDANSGDANSGYRNSGNRNSGNANSGNWNSGDANSGDANSGNWNSGNANSGNANSGNRNSGNRNSGNANSGNWNSGDANSGDGYRNYFCTDEKFFLFNQECSREDAKKINEIDFSFFSLVDENGNLIDYKTAWEKCPASEIEKIKKLKNFDPDIFEEITGIKVKVRKKNAKKSI